MTYQSPHLPTANTIIERIQKAIDNSVFSGGAAVKHATLRQHVKDVGMGQTDIGAMLDATGSRRIGDMVSDPTHKSWHNFYKHQLWKHY